MHNPRLHPRHATHPTTTPRARVLLFLLVQLDHVVWSQGEGGGRRSHQVMLIFNDVLYFDFHSYPVASGKPGFFFSLSYSLEKMNSIPYHTII